MKTYTKLTSLILSLMAILSLLSVSASASFVIEHEDLAKAYELGLVRQDELNHFNPYGPEWITTATKADVSDLFTRAFLDNPTADTKDIAHMDEPATIAFIAMAYESATGLKLEDAPHWRYLSSGDYVAAIEVVSLAIATLERLG
ncbi:hypothetical protein IJJ37_01200 [Candidatus Saccharibacteria bacterium]|nr:hypothetical protein [Candidatus Saccharibacteria bacterium]